MPTAIPNFFKAQTPLGASLQGLAAQLAAQPTDAQQQTQALGIQKAQGDVQKQSFDLGQAQQEGAARTKLGDLFTDPRLTDPTFSPSAAPAPPALGDMGVASTPINRAFQPDYGEMARTSINAGYKPEDLGKMLLVLGANGGGARAQGTQNAQVGSGENFNATADAFDTGQNNEMVKAANTNKTSIANNTATNATSRANNAATIAAENQRAAAARENVGVVDPNAVQFGINYFKTFGVLPPNARNKDMQQAIMAGLNQEMTGGGMSMQDAANAKAGMVAKNAAASQGGRQQLQTQINEDTANGAAGIIQNLLKKGVAGPTNITGVNDLLVWAKQHSNDPDAANLVNGINSFSNEYARVTTGATNGSPSSDRARDEAGQRILKGYNAGTINDVLGQMHYEMRQRSEAQHHALGDVTGGHYAGVGATPGMGQWDNVPSANPPAAPAAPGGWTVQKR